AGQGGQQGGDGHESGGAGAEGERRDDHADGGGQQTGGGDGPFEGRPGEQGGHRDDRLGAGAVVVGQPEGEEHHRGGPVGDPAAVDTRAEAGQDLTGEHEPDDQAGEQRRHTHPHRGGGHLGEQG